MAKRPRKAPSGKLITGIIAGLITLAVFIGGLSVELAGKELTELLEGRWYAPLVVWGGLAATAAVAFGSGFWVFKHSKPSPEERPVNMKDVAGTNVATSSGGGVNIAADKVEIDGDVVGGDKIIYQILPPAAAPTALHQIPPPPGDFTGRTRELTELMRQIEQGGVAISGVRGTGGIGKTALARKLVQQLTPRYPDAQIELDLKGTSPQPLSPAEAMAHVIHAFHPEARLPEGEAELGALYRSVLHGQRALLLMDNAANREQVQPLVPPQGCVLLVTSRQLFHLPGLFPLDLNALPPEDAQKLLLAIEGRIGQEAEAIARLCGYLPLALEVAASALKVRVDLPPAEYRRRLESSRQLFPEVDASLGLSYDLLIPELQQQWRALAVFPDTFHHGAAGAVWQLELDPARDVLGALLAYSLVQWDPERQRYRLHDLARLYAGSRLPNHERTAAQQRHAQHFRDVLGVANQLYLEGGDKLMQGLALFDQEWGNIQAGQAWVAEHSEQDDGAAELCSGYAGVGSLLDLRQHPRERIRWLEAALAAARRLKDREAEGRHLGNLGNAYRQLGEARRAIEHHQQALVVTREIGDRRGEGAALGNLGLAYAELGEPRRAIEYYEQCLVIHREIGDRRGEGNDLGNQGNAYGDLGETHRAIDYHQQALAISREIGDRRGEGADLGNLGSAYLELGEARRAIQYCEQHLTIAREMGDRQGEGSALGNLGSAYLTLGEPRRAIEYHEQALAIDREIGDRRGEGTDLWNTAVALEQLEDRPQAMARAEAARQIFEEIENPNVAMVREVLARWRGEGESPPS
jgi:tetratricopeptide (TPR) repeat protein